MILRPINQTTYQILTIAWLAVIAIFSSIPNLKTSAVIPQSDKYLHIIVFAVLAYLLAGSAGKFIKKYNVVFPILLITTLAVLFGFLDEWHQSTVVGRVSSGWDILADGVGGLIGVIAYLFIHKTETDFG